MKRRHGLLVGLVALASAAPAQASGGELKASSLIHDRAAAEQALRLVQYISPAVAVYSPKVQNFRECMISVPKLTEVWLKA